VAEKGSPRAAQAKRQELVDKLERGFQRIQTSENRRYLDTVSRFHQYSVSNTILISRNRLIRIGSSIIGSDSRGQAAGRVLAWEHVCQLFNYQTAA
jgi:hypothetical protein